MPTQKTFKRRVRVRMTKTGESYTTARRQLLRKGETPPETRPEPTLPNEPTLSAEPTDAGSAAAVSPAAGPQTSDSSAVRATGRDYASWFELIDDWDGTNHSHTEIARWLVTEHGVDGWWSQSITVGYERARGMRAVHERPGGFEISATRTIAAPLDQALSAFTDDALRERWLPGSGMTRRRTSARNLARFDWPAPASRIVVTVVDKGPAKTLVAITHEKLPDGDAAAEQKAAWRVRLTALKSLLEAR